MRTILPEINLDPKSKLAHHADMKQRHPIPTPRTDAIARGNHVVPTEWAEELERELAEAKETETYTYKGITTTIMGWMSLWDMVSQRLQFEKDEANDLERELVDLKDSIASMSHPNIKDLLSELAEARERIDRLAEAAHYMRQAMKDGPCMWNYAIDFYESTINQIKQNDE